MFPYYFLIPFIGSIGNNEQEQSVPAFLFNFQLEYPIPIVQQQLPQQLVQNVPTIIQTQNQSERRIVTHQVQKVNKSRKKNKVLKKKESNRYRFTNRNITSLLLQQLIKFIMRKAFCQTLINQIISFHKLSVTYNQIILFLSKIPYERYIKISTMQKIWSSTIDPQLTKTLRILSYHFLKYKSYLIVCKNGRTINTSKYQHLKKIREIVKILENIQDN